MSSTLVQHDPEAVDVRQPANSGTAIQLVFHAEEALAPAAQDIPADSLHAKALRRLSRNATPGSAVSGIATGAEADMHPETGQTAHQGQFPVFRGMSISSLARHASDLVDGDPSPRLLEARLTLGLPSK